MKHILNIFITALFFYGSSSYCSNIPRVFIFHINGINTSFIEADRNRVSLQNTANTNSNIIIWDVIYNSTNGLLTSDIWDVMRMKKQESKNLTLDDYVVTYMKRNNLNYPVNSPEYKKLKNDIKQIYLDDSDVVGKNLSDIVKQFHDKVPPPYASVVELLNQYKNVGTNNAYVLLIPHSQGNQYANQLWKFLVNDEHFPKSHLAIFGIASPTDEMLGTVKPANQDNYYTADNDFVINSLAALSSFIPETKKPMGGNLHLYTCKDIICHKLIESYLTDSESKYRIGNRISFFIIALKKNLIEEQLGKNINGLFWMDERFAHAASLRNVQNKTVCEISKCDDKIINYLETSLSQFDPYKGYKWSSNLIPGPYTLLVHRNSYHLLGPNPDDYFFIRGNITRAMDFFFKDCLINFRERRQIENISSSPFYGKPIAGIGSQVNVPCNLPDEILAENNTKIILGEFLLV